MSHIATSTPPVYYRQWHNLMYAAGYRYSACVWLHRNGFAYHTDDAKHGKILLSHFLAGTTPPPF
jgi:hypothetical protein